MYSLHSISDRDWWFDVSPLGEYLELAYNHGWEPMGTEFLDWDLDKESPNYEEELKGMQESWEGGYLSNDGQLIKEEDSLNIARALERGLLDIGVYLHNDNGKLDGEEQKDVFEKRFCLNIGTETTLDEANERLWIRRGRIAELIVFCRKGGFLIF